MKKSYVFNKLKTQLNLFNSYGIELNENTQLIEELGLDSLTMLQLIALIESEFNIKIKEIEITRTNFNTIINLSTFIHKKLKM